MLYIFMFKDIFLRIEYSLYQHIYKAFLIII